MTHINDARFTALRAFGFTGTISDMIDQWAVANGATPNSVVDQVVEVLVANGATSHQINDAWHEALRLNGYTGSNNDMIKAFWDAGGSFGAIIDSFLTVGGASWNISDDTSYWEIV